MSTEEKVLARIGQSYAAGVITSGSVSSTAVVLTPTRIYGAGQCLENKHWVTKSFNGEIVNLSSIGINTQTDVPKILVGILLCGIAFCITAGFSELGLFSVLLIVSGLYCFVACYSRVLAINMQGVAYPLKLNGIQDSEVMKFISLAQDTAEAARREQKNAAAQTVNVVPPAASAADSPAEKLRQLKSLRDEAIISEEEYQAKRKVLLEKL